MTSPFTPASDLAFVRSMTSIQLRTIRAALKKERGTVGVKTGIGIPEEFIRLLFVYSNYLEHPRRPNELPRTLSDILDWFKHNLPGVENLPGYTKLLAAGREVMKDIEIEIGDESVRHEAIVRSVGEIDGYACYPSFGGPNMSPMIRSFFFNGDYLLFDSTGDWNNWLYVTRCLLTSINDQAEAMAQFQKLDRFDWSKATEEIAEIESRVKSIRKFLEMANANPKLKAKRITPKRKSSD